MGASIEPLERADQTVVIVGAGLAGVRVAEGLRGAGFPGRMVLVGDEAHQPYDRPPLSKAVLQVDGHEHTIALSPDGAMAALNVELRLGQSAVSIARDARQLELASGEAIAYDRLVLATGSQVRTLAVLPPGGPGVHYMRGLDDALALRAQLVAGARVAIVGGGVIGLEVAASARSRGCAVTVIEAGERAMARAASPPISAFIQDRHAREGVDLRLGVTVSGVEFQEAGPIRLRLSTGEVREADVVVVGVGVTPNLDLARSCGLETRGDGIVVDGHGATSDPAIYAAGEVAVHFNGAYGRHDRQENWAHAAAHGEHVGRSLASPAAPYHQVTSYWTDQYDINLQVVGIPIGEIDVVRGDPASGKFLVFHLLDGRIEGVSSVNAVRELRAAKKLIGSAQPADLEALANPAVDLAALA
jgi:3-phenylpropionate/trans-cinnamate dioxygenase ferredoxin reductase subunit